MYSKIASTCISYRDVTACSSPLWACAMRSCSGDCGCITHPYRTWRRSTRAESRPDIDPYLFKRNMLLFVMRHHKTRTFDLFVSIMEQTASHRRRTSVLESITQDQGDFL